jgi:hypothetical protein
VTHLKISETAYFLQVLGRPLRLSFGRDYGPYAEHLNRVLDQLKGHYLVGYGDRTARVEELRPINLTPGTSAAVSEWFASSGANSEDALRRLARLVDGYETPYSLELLATVHFAAEQPPRTTDIEELIERVRAWSGRKARLFTPAHIRSAHHRLQSAGLLPALANA